MDAKVCRHSDAYQGLCHHSNRCQLHNNRANGWQGHAINQLGDKETLITQMNAKETASTEILVKVRAITWVISPGSSHHSNGQQRQSVTQMDQTHKSQGKIQLWHGCKVLEPLRRTQVSCTTQIDAINTAIAQMDAKCKKSARWFTDSNHSDGCKRKLPLLR